MNPIQLLAITVSLSVPIGGGPVTLDVTPLLAAPAPIPGTAQAVTLPGVVLYDTAYDAAWLDHRDPHDPTGTNGTHELQHARQMAALGPAYWLAYGLTLGEVFEPYLPRQWFITQGWENAYTAPKDAHDYPLLRFRVSDGAVSATLLPGYPTLTHPDPLEPRDAPTVVVAEDWTNDYWQAHYALDMDVSDVMAGTQ